MSLELHDCLRDGRRPCPEASIVPSSTHVGGYRHDLYRIGTDTGHSILYQMSRPDFKENLLHPPHRAANQHIASRTVRTCGYENKELFPKAEYAPKIQQWPTAKR
jgi:hypothetical protein